MKAFENIKQITIDDRDHGLVPFGVYVDAVTDDGIVTLCRCESRIVAEALRKAIYHAKFAAPDMLEALKEFVQACELVFHYVGPTFAHPRKQAKAAIRKAEGM